MSTFDLSQKVAVLMGGMSAEREVSLEGGKAVTKALQAKGVNAYAVDVDWQIVKRLDSEQFDCAFIMMHGRGGEDGTIQGLLEWMQIPYTGSNVLSSAVSMDKLITKQIWHDFSLPTAPFVILKPDSDFESVIDELGAVMVKPAREGSSVGMSKATDGKSLMRSFEDAYQYDQIVIAEQWITGGEYTVSILGEDALPVIKIQTTEKFYDYHAKYLSDTTEYLIPSGLSDEQTVDLQEISIKAFKALGCSGWGRVDMMIGNDNKPLLLEVNTIPGMTSHSLVPKAAGALGIDFNELVWQILSTAQLHNELKNG